jgi:hypothetical protein
MLYRQFLTVMLTMNRLVGPNGLDLIAQFT